MCVAIEFVCVHDRLVVCAVVVCGRRVIVSRFRLVGLLVVVVACDCCVLVVLGVAFVLV